MRILGIDPGLASVGYGIVEERPGASQIAHVAHGVIRTSATEPVAARLQCIFERLSQVIAAQAPDAVAVEELFFAVNVKTVIGVAQGRGVAILATAEAQLPLFEYAPLEIKQALVGYGRADKRQVQLMVKAVLGLKEIPRPDHAADALATALCHLHGLRPLRQLARATEEAASEDPRKAEIKELIGRRRRRSRRR